MIPSFLSELVRTVLVMSISGGLIILILLILKPFVRHRLPKSLQYYLWIAALVVMLLPLSQIAVLPESAAFASPVSIVVERNVVSYTEEVARNQPSAPTVIYSAHLDENVVTTQPPSPSPSISSVLSTAFMLIYPVAAILVLLYNIISYALFIRKLRRDSMQPSPAKLDILNQLTKGKRTPNLIISPYAQTPMLIGLFSPTIVLPDLLILQGDDNEQLKSILLHELAHMRHSDIVIKWLSLFACAIHWFNPLVWVLRRELDRICELSCDEAVITDMDTMARQSYGETLIAVASSEKVPLPILRTTMCSEKRALKERLSAIMKSKRRTKLALVISSVILFVIIFSAGTVGAGTRHDVTTNVNTPQSILDAVVYSYIEDMTAMLYVFEEDTATARPVNILDTHINHFGMIFEFDNILDYPVQMWHLDFIIQTDDIEDGNIRWGTFAPDDNGWVGKHMGWHDSDVIMILAMNPLGMEFLGTLERWSAYEVIDEASAESALRNFLSDKELLAISPIPHVGVAHETHRIVNALPLPDSTWRLNSIQIGADHGGFGYGPYTLTVFYDTMDISQYMPSANFEANAARLFEFIENLEAVTFSINILVASVAVEYNYRWSITRESSAMGGSAVTSFNGSLRPLSAIPVADEVMLTARPILQSPPRDTIPSRVLAILDTLEIGVMRANAETIFAPYTMGQRVTRVYGSGYAYRYDLISNIDYMYICPLGADTLDLTGLQEGRVRLIVFVNVTYQDIVESFTVSYSISDGSVYTIRIHSGEDSTPFRILDGGDWNHNDSILWN